jgi:hypothetical protein
MYKETTSCPVARLYSVQLVIPVCLIYVTSILVSLIIFNSLLNTSAMPIVQAAVSSHKKLPGHPLLLLSPPTTLTLTS